MLDPFNNDIPEYGCEPIFMDEEILEEEKNQLAIRMGIYLGLAVSPYLVPVLMKEASIFAGTLLRNIFDKFKEIGPFVGDLFSKGKIPQFG